MWRSLSSCPIWGGEKKAWGRRYVGSASKFQQTSNTVNWIQKNSGALIGWHPVTHSVHNGSSQGCIFCLCCLKFKLKIYNCWHILDTAEGCFPALTFLREVIKVCYHKDRERPTCPLTLWIICGCAEPDKHDKQCTRRCLRAKKKNQNTDKQWTSKTTFCWLYIFQAIYFFSYKIWNAFWTLQVFSSFFFFLPFLLFGHLPHLHLVALLTGNGQSDHQGNKLLKVHLAVAVGVQVLHDFVHGCGVLLGLSFKGESEKS